MRILTTNDLKRMIDMSSSISAPTFKKFANTLCENGYLFHVARGLYLNAKATPKPSLAEVAHYIRPGCVVSLQTVLGDCGFINNPTSVVMAITTDHGTKYSGAIQTSSQFDFHFRYLPGNMSHVRLGGLDNSFPFYQRATPERALADWIYFANSSYSPLTYPPIDVDMESIDFSTALDFAKKMGIEVAMQSWHQRAKSLGFGEEGFENPKLLSIEKVKTKKYKKVKHITWISSEN